MGEFRQDLTTKDWVLVAAKRAGKPTDFKNQPATPDPESLPEVSDDCPFCEGEKNDTPVIIKQYPERGQWKVRIVPNKFNVLEHGVHNANPTCEFYCSRPAVGEHEVIFTYPHNKPTALQDEAVIDLTLKAYIDRGNQLRDHEEIKYLHIIQNHGAQAGASLIHPHSQIFTAPFVPERIQEEINGTRHYFESNKNCLYCDIVDYEIEKKERVVLETDNFLVITPYAAKVPYQMRILPKQHAADFCFISDSERQALAKVMKEIFSRLFDRLNNPAYNYYIHTLPFFVQKESKTWDHNKFYHWHFVVVPRFSKFAGFELGTEVYVNTVSPEQAAEVLGDKND